MGIRIFKKCPLIRNAAVNKSVTNHLIFKDLICIPIGSGQMTELISLFPFKVKG